MQSGQEPPSGKAASKTKVLEEVTVADTEGSTVGTVLARWVLP